MRKKLFFSILILIIFSVLPTMAENWDDYTDLDKAWEGQKTVTNQEFEKVMDALNDKNKKNEEKKKRKKFKKILGGGESLHEEMNSEKSLNEIPDLKANKDGSLVSIPVDVFLDKNILERGFYNVVGERKKDGKVYLKFYQSQFLKGEIEAIETTDDFEEKTIDFARLLPYNDGFVKIIFGSIDFNAYVYIPFKY